MGKRVRRPRGSLHLAGSACGGHSGLHVSTLRKYARSELLELGEGGESPIYMHHGKCPNYCDYACNGHHGFDIATDIDELQLHTPNSKSGATAHEHA